MSRCTKCNQEIPKPRVSLNVSEIMEKLRGQYGPNIAQLSEVSRIVEDIDKDVADYQKEILRMQRHILLLTSKCDRAQVMKRRVQGLTSPIRRLPNEILVRILEYSCARNVFDHLSYPFGSPWFERVAALAASAVCSRWRQLALSTPGVWASFFARLSGDENNYPKEVHLARFIKLFLRRSGEHPLSVDLELPYWDPEEWDDRPGGRPSEHPVVEAVLTNAYRLEMFAYNALYHPLSFNSVNWDSPLSFPMLRRASVSQSTDHEDPMDTAHFFSKAPSLKELTIDGICDVDDEPGSFDWSRMGQQLTYLDIYTESPSLFKAIGLCTQLSTLRLDVHHYYHDRAPDRPAEPLVLSNLRSLHMRVTDGPSDRFPDDMVRIILSSLATPSLEELSIVPDRDYGFYRQLDHDYSASWPGEEILGLLERSKCALTKLTLKIRVSGYQLVTLLHHLGSLHELTVDGRHTDVTVARSLIPRLHGFDGGSMQPLVPKLSQLSLVISGTRQENKFDDGKFVDMVISRWDPELLHGSDTGLACLRSVSLHLVGMEVDSDAYKPLRVLEGSGMNLNLIGKSST